MVFPWRAGPVAREDPWVRDVAIQGLKPPETPYHSKLLYVLLQVHEKELHLPKET